MIVAVADRNGRPLYRKVCHAGVLSQRRMVILNNGYSALTQAMRLSIGVFTSVVLVFIVRLKLKSFPQNKMKGRLEFTGIRFHEADIFRAVGCEMSGIRTVDHSSAYS